MTSDSRSIHEDLAFLRSLVDEDWRPGVWVFGAMYASIGATLLAHMLVSWGVQAGYLPLQGRSLLAAYVALYAPASIYWAWLSRHFRHDRRPSGVGRSVRGRAGAVALGSAFLAYFAMLAVFVIVAWRQRNGVFLELAPLALFALQSVPWFVVHAMNRHRWQLAVAWGWLLGTLALAPLVGTDAFGPGVGVVAVALMIVPGIYMMRVACRA